jgi:hypothetical protein
MAYSTFVIIPGDGSVMSDVTRISNPSDVVAHVINAYGGQLNPNPPTPPNRVVVTVNPNLLVTT